MAHLANNELTDIVLEYEQAGQNAVQARHIYQELFPNRRIPTQHSYNCVIYHVDRNFANES
jgi:hypothetical protein